MNAIIIGFYGSIKGNNSEQFYEIMQLPGNDGVLRSYHIQNTMVSCGSLLFFLWNERSERTADIIRSQIRQIHKINWLVLIFDLRVLDEFSSYHVTFSWKGLPPTSLKVFITFTELKFTVKLPFHPVV